MRVLAKIAGDEKFYLLVGMFWFGLILYIPVNSYGHVGKISSPTTLFPGQA